MKIAYAVLGLLLLPAGLCAQRTSVAKASALKWGPAPPVFPKGATTAVTAMGPLALTYVNPADNPQKRAGKP